MRQSGDGPGRGTHGGFLRVHSAFRKTAGGCARSRPEFREIRALPDYRRPPVVRSAYNGLAARHAAGSHHSVDVQQVQRAISSTRGQRFAKPDRDEPRRRDRAGRGRAGRILPPGEGGQDREGARGQGTARHVFGWAGTGRSTPGSIASTSRSTSRTPTSRLVSWSIAAARCSSAARRRRCRNSTTPPP